MIPLRTRVYFATQPADLRRSFDGLAALAASELERDPREGGLFVFVNRRANQVRILFRDSKGWCLLAKRLDRGRFRRPHCESGRFVWEADATVLLEWLENIDLSGASRRTRRAVERQLQIVRDSR